jgi:hypothetical protein
MECKIKETKLEALGSFTYTFALSEKTSLHPPKQQGEVFLTNFILVSNTPHSSHPQAVLSMPPLRRFLFLIFHHLIDPTRSQ